MSQTLTRSAKEVSSLEGSPTKALPDSGSWNVVNTVTSVSCRGLMEEPFRQWLIL